VHPSRSTSSVPRVPSTPTSPNTQAFQQALALALNSPRDPPADLDPPDPDPSDSDHSSDHSDIFLDDDDNNISTTALVDVKAGLSEDFSGRNEDARRWILAMSTYFNMCRPRYTEKQMKLILLNKMSKGRGADFSKGWLSKIADDTVPEEHKSKELIVHDFEKVFLPTDKTSRAWAALANLHMEGPPFRGDFHGFCSSFELEAGKSGVENENVLKDLLRQAVSTDLAFKMTSLENELKTYKDWLTKAGQFYDVTQRLKELCSGSHTYVPSGGYRLSSTSHRDPNAMDVDVLRLSPTQRAEHMHNNKCFICHKVGCCSNKHSRPGNKATTRPPASTSSSLVRATTVPETSENNPLLNYARKLNISEKEAIRSLGIVYGELNQDGTIAESGSAEEVVAHMDF